MKRVMSLTLALIMCFSLFSGGAVFAHGREGFKDIRDDYWAKDVIEELVMRKVITGFPDNTFRPRDHITKEQLAVILVKALNLSLEVNVGTFVDVPEWYWASTFIEAAKDYLTAYKTSEGLVFRPREKVVREDIVVAIVKASKLDLTGEEILDEYEDGDLVSKNLRPYVATAVENKLIQGYEIEGKKFLKPLDLVTRAEVAKMIINLGNETGIEIGEKVVVGDEDLGEEDPAEYSDEINLSANMTNRSMVLNWDPVSVEGFRGYKVVISKSNEDPTYPGDGYYEFITDNSETEVEVPFGAIYHNGDFRVFGPGKYYVRIVVLRKDGFKKLHSNVVRVEVLGDLIPAKDFNLNAAVENGELKLKWDEASADGFNGYKIVMSKTNPNPTYPDDGYHSYITDRSTTSASVWLGEEYNGEDFDVVEPGGYFVRIVVLRDGMPKLHSNVKFVLINSPPVTPYPETITLEATVQGDKLHLDWTPISSQNFKYYKIVMSKSDSDPTYPENGYQTYITDASQTEHDVFIGDSYKNGDFDKVGHGKYYVRITAVRSGGLPKVNSNVVEVEM